jgi:hypothetical protein
MDFGQREDQECDRDRDNAVTEGNDPVDTCFSFMCHLLASAFRLDQLPPSAFRKYRSQRDRARPR